MVMEKPTVDEVVSNIESTIPKMWLAGFIPLYRDGNRLWLRHPDRERIIRIEVTELPRDHWPELPAIPLPPADR